MTQDEIEAWVRDLRNWILIPLFGAIAIAAIVMIVVTVTQAVQAIW